MFVPLIYIIFIFLQFCKCKNLLEEIISNPIQVYHRENRVLFAVSNDFSKEEFQKLLINYLSLEEMAKNVTSRLINHKTDIRFGGIKNISLTPYDSLEDLEKCSDCFESSKVYNVSEVVSTFIVKTNKSCINEPKKYYTLIISDQCLTFLNLKLNDGCQGDYQHIGLMLPTSEDVKACKKKLLKEVNGNKEKVYLNTYSFNAANQQNTEEDNLFSSYFDMNIMYRTTMATSKINLFVLVNSEIRVPYYSLRCKFTYSKFERCMKTADESIVGHFQYGTPNGTVYHKAIMSSPLSFDNADDLINNYKILLNQSLTSSNFECDTVKEYLTSLNNLPSDESNEQFNVLILDDSLECFESFQFEWNNSVRHLEIIVIHNGTIKNDYSNFITFPKNSLNHLIFYKNEWNDVENYEEYCDFDPICTSIISRSQNVKLDEIKVDRFVLILITVVTLMFLIFAVAFIVYLKMKALSQKRKDLIKERIESVYVFETKNSKNVDYWNLLLDDQDVVINYGKILGKGSKATVYQASYKKPFNLLSNTKVAAKVSKNTENSIDLEFIDELNALVILQEHDNIISLIGWTMSCNETIIVTELAETNLYEFIQFHRYNSNIMKWSLQILWQISNALEFVAENEMIHRDVACRNILIFNKNIAKLADFGLCCKSDKNGIFKDTTHKKFPLKWLAIEALIDRTFSEKSDVWAFGVTCFEVFSHGEIPYSSIPHSEMVEYLESGKRLQKPANVAPHIFDLMFSCWAKEPLNRPSFKEIRKGLEVVLEYGYLPLEKTV